MGKASEIAGRLKPLSHSQVKARKVAAEIADPDVIATLEGSLEKKAPQRAPQVVQPSQPRTWD
jgi:hypothetical protein